MMIRMSENRARRRGFTLIELLIVVLIIAILAAIAVPNFLEFQTRSKVARVKSDMRSIATAMEGYCVDYGEYTFRDAGDGPGYYTQGLAQLTTPISYMSQVPLDSWGRYDDIGVPRWPMLELGTGNAGRRQSSGTPNSPQTQGQPVDTWLIRSVGADKEDDTLVNSYPWSLSQIPDNDRGCATILSYVYDPTNGSVSPGDIFRIGGAKPGGKPWDAFFPIVSN